MKMPARKGPLSINVFGKLKLALRRTATSKAALVAVSAVVAGPA